MATLRGLETMSEALDHDEVPVPDAQGMIHFERRLNAEISIVQLPQGKDPDELIRRAPEKWLEVVATARPFLDFYIETIANGVAANDAPAKSAAVARAAPVLRQIADRVVQAHYIRLLAERLGLPEQTVGSETRRNGLRTAARPRTEARPRLQRISHEDHLMALLVRHRELCRDIIAQVPTEDLLDARNRQLLQFLADASVPDVSVEQLIAGMDDILADHAERLVATLAATPAELPGQVHHEAMQALELLSRERFDFLMRQLQAGIQDAQREHDASALQELLGQIPTSHRSASPLLPAAQPIFPRQPGPPRLMMEA